MKRRAFMGMSAGCGAVGGSAGLAGAAGAKPATGTIGGLSLKELREAYRTDLFDEYLPFMDEHVVDHEYRGFMCTTTYEGVHISTEKRATYEGRGLWVYSFLYGNLAREQRWLDVAEKSAALLMKHKPQGDALWPSKFDREGEAIAPPSASVNADLYIADGFAEFARATGDDGYRKLAADILLKCLRVYDGPGYGENMGRGYVGKDVPPIQGIRIMDDWMLFLRAATRLLVQKDDPRIEAIAKRCVDTIMNNFYNPATRLVGEMLNHDHSRPDNDYAQVVNFGNVFQALWHVMDEALRTGNRELFLAAAERLKRHIEVAWDDVYGGVYTVLEHIDENRWRLGKTHYAQVETLVGLLLVMEHTGAGRARDLFDMIYRYIGEKFPQRQYGYPLWILSSDRKVGFREKTSRIGNFHQPRHLMLNLAALDRMIGRGGKTSGVFG